MKMQKIVLTVARIVAAIIMLQTLYFKFSGAEESVYIFTRIGMEPWGRFGVGVGELVAAALLLYRPVSWLGGLAGIGLMSGAVFFHLTVLGLDVKDDGGYLFFLALAVLICSIIVVAMQYQQALEQLRRWTGRSSN